MILALLATVLSIPVITIGASVTAAFYVGMKLVRNEEGYILKDFWKSWVRNLKQSIGLELIIVIIGAILIIDMNVCGNWANADGGMLAIVIMYLSMGLLLVLAAVTIYAFPMLAKFDNSVINTLKNALVICMHHLPQTIIMLIGTVGLIVFSFEYLVAYIITVPLIIYIDSYVLARIFQIYAKQSEQTEDSAAIEEVAAKEEN